MKECDFPHFFCYLLLWYHLMEIFKYYMSHYKLWPQLVHIMGRQMFVVVPLKRTYVNFTEKWEEDSCRCVVGHLFVSSTKAVYENNGGRNCYQSKNCTVMLLVLYFVNNMFEPCAGWLFQIMCAAGSFSSPLEKVGRAMRSVTVDGEARGKPRNHVGCWCCEVCVGWMVPEVLPDGKTATVALEGSGARWSEREMMLWNACTWDSARNAPIMGHL